jgi:zinc/manganese transport system ATP-binding protein
MTASAIALTGAATEVSGRVVWRDVDVTLDRGEFVAVLGPNGVGKSTLVRAVLGLQPLSGGSITVLDRRPEQARADVGYLPQRRSFDPDLHVRGVDIVRLGADGDKWGIPSPFGKSATRRGHQARIDEVIEQVGATTYAGRAIGHVSGGEQQRLLIAQALVRRPQILLLDEPLDSLDLPNQSAIAALVARLSRDEGITVVLVAHDVNPILPYLDRVVYLGQGGAVAGPPAEVITTETLSRLYGTSVEVLRASDGRLVVVGQPEAPAHHHDRHEH